MTMEIDPRYQAQNERLEQIRQEIHATTQRVEARTGADGTAMASEEVQRAQIQDVVDHVEGREAYDLSGLSENPVATLQGLKTSATEEVGALRERSDAAETQYTEARARARAERGDVRLATFEVSFDSRLLRENATAIGFETLTTELEPGSDAYTAYVNDIATRLLNDVRLDPGADGTFLQTEVRQWVEATLARNTALAETEALEAELAQLEEFERELITEVDEALAAQRGVTAGNETTEDLNQQLVRMRAQLRDGLLDLAGDMRSDLAEAQAALDVAIANNDADEAAARRQEITSINASLTTVRTELGDYEGQDYASEQDFASDIDETGALRKVSIDAEFNDNPRWWGVILQTLVEVFTLTLVDTEYWDGDRMSREQGERLWATLDPAQQAAMRQLLSTPGGSERATTELARSFASRPEYATNRRDANEDARLVIEGMMDAARIQRQEEAAAEEAAAEEAAAEEAAQAR
ncbi:MAG: hypothetical protein AAF654_14000 [Myxococcota bacterium]